MKFVPDMTRKQIRDATLCMVKMWRLSIRTRDRQRRKGSATKVVLLSRNEGLSIGSVV